MQGFHRVPLSPWAASLSCRTEPCHMCSTPFFYLELPSLLQTIIFTIIMVTSFSNIDRKKSCNIDHLRSMFVNGPCFSVTACGCLDGPPLLDPNILESILKLKWLGAKDGYPGSWKSACVAPPSVAQTAVDVPFRTPGSIEFTMESHPLWADARVVSTCIHMYPLPVSHYAPGFGAGGAGRCWRTHSPRLRDPPGRNQLLQCA